MASFNFQSSSSKKSLNVAGFLGVDFTSNPENTDMRRSPQAKNMIRETPGKNKKRSGFKCEHTFKEEIYGIHFFEVGGVEKFIVHAGKKLYLRENNEWTVIYEYMNEARSSSAVLGGKLFIVDGIEPLIYNGETVALAKYNSYVPTIIIGRSPSGGGVIHEPINMLSNYRIEKFTPDGTTKRYYLSASDITTIVNVQKRTATGEWVYMDDDEYTKNISSASVTFNVAPNEPSDGADSIAILYIKENYEYRDIMRSCNICTLYGVNGNMDRIFLTGTPKYPNRDYYCQIEDPTYWGDTWYNCIGKSDSPIIGYSIVSDCLATHKRGEDSNANIILREGKIIDKEACFLVVGTFPSGGAVATYSFGTLDNEPVYLAEDGINAITPSDVLGERFSQVRSYFLNGKLLSETNMENASAVSYKGFYMLLLNEKMYILDGLQSVIPGGKPFSHRQYEGYFWENIPGKFLYTDGETLYMAGKEGKLYRFSDEENTDDGEPFEASWEFAEFFGDDFSVLKTITHIDIMVDSGARDTILEFCDDDGNWKQLTETGSNYGDKVISKKVHIKDCVSAKLRIRNVLGEDFKLNKMKLSFIDGRKIR